ncbi:hypothetical protein LguiA_006987 [Lonicera macranthoides]
MEEIGAQVAPPFFIHQTLAAGRFPMSSSSSRKRTGTNFQQQHSFTESEFQKPRDSWNPKVWDWDSSRFVATPSESDVRLGISAAAAASSVQLEPQRRRNRCEEESSLPSKSNHRGVGVGEDDGSLLRLKLGRGALLNPIEEEEESARARPNKKVRSGSPGNYPMCQVDNCKEDLSNAKDYHRRHKVCDLHSKATQALVSKQLQRFCQQCSRFHPLSEFDEGKRSCRRRLAGHNRRRRKSQPEDAPPRLLLPGNRDNNTAGGDMDIVNLLTVLARAQGSKEDGNTTCASAPNKDQLIQILNKINSLPLPVDLTAKLPTSGGLNGSVRGQLFSENQPMLNGNHSSASTMDLLAVLSTTLAAPAPDALAIMPQGHDIGETKLTGGLERTTCLDLQKVSDRQLPSAGDRSGTSYQSPVGDLDCRVQENRANLPLQLFSSSPENDSRPKLASGRKYFSSDSSNSMEERSPSSSPPIAQTLFPMQTSRETVKPESMSTSGEVTANVEASRIRGGVMSLELFGGSNRGASNAKFQSYPYQAGYTSSSGSDNSHSSLNSDAQDRTGRIIFKLFDKDPSHLPGTLRTEIYNWLSRSPSEMESYIRPGCVVLSVYISMSSSVWEQLEVNLCQYVNSLVQDSGTKFWRNGRFLVHIGRQLAAHKDGKVHLFKSWKACSSPELISVSPLAVVGGQETSLLLRGRNLRTTGTKIHCTHTSGYKLQELSRPASQENIYDEISLSCFTIHGAASSALGRCFIEVENGFRGTSFPVIIADAAICQELRFLESEFNEGAKVHDARDQIPDVGQRQSRDEVLHFLNDLGWLFQRKGISSLLEAPYFMLNRFKFLFIFSVERDFCSLVKTLLDILLKRNVVKDEWLMESLEMLREIHILNRAVKRRCKKMVDMLIRYSIPCTTDTSQQYIFPPNLGGPGGITPLHLAACTPCSDDMVDVLTSDPLEIGLVSWNSVLDANGLSPYVYALMRNNHSYNNLVARKLVGQVCVSIGGEIEQQQSLTEDQGHRPRSQFKEGQKTCSTCAVVAGRYHTRIPGSQGLLHRPYIHSMLAIAAVCVCVCLFLRGSPDIGLVAPFKWENLDYGPS